MPSAHSVPGSERTPRRINRRRLVAWINLALGVILWFGYCTDCSWAGAIPDYCYPPAVALVAFVSLLLRDRHADERSRFIYKLALMPSLIGGGLSLLLAVVMLIPPFTLGLLFTAAEIKDERLIQTVASPGGVRVADVYFRGVGAYSGGNGRVFIRVRNRRLPVVERDMFCISRSYADENTHDYVRWKDDRTLRIIGEPNAKPQEFEVGSLRLEIPEIVALPVRMVRVLLTGWGGRQS